MKPTEKYFLLRQAGFSHTEAIKYINQGVRPNCNTEAKQRAYKQLTGPSEESSTKKQEEHYA